MAMPATGTKPTPRPLPNTYPGPTGPGGNNFMFSMMQIMMKMMMMMTQFRPGGGVSSPYASPANQPFNAGQQPSPFAYSGGQQSFFL